MVVCLVRGEGGSFYSPRRSVPVRIKYGNTGHHLQEDKDDLPAKVEVDWRQSGAGRPCGSAGPRVPLLAPPFVLDTARWAPNLCMSVPGLCTSIFYVKWASFGCVTQTVMFCVFLLRLLRVSCYFRLMSLQSTIHQHSWNLLVIILTTTVDVHFSCLYAGVDGIYFALNSRQQ